MNWKNISFFPHSLSIHSLFLLIFIFLLLFFVFFSSFISLAKINMMNLSVLMKENSKLIAVHEGKYFKRGDGLAVGPGCFTRGLEYATGKTATVIGKPNSYFFNSAIPMGIMPQECCMIGDVSVTLFIRTFFFVLHSYSLSSFLTLSLIFTIHPLVHSTIQH